MSNFEKLPELKVQHSSQKSIHKHSIHRASNQYDPDVIPPKWKLAEDHFKCRRIGPEKTEDDIIEEGVENDEEKGDDKVNVCDCCGRIVDRLEPSICSYKEDLSDLGPGYPLFFYYMEYCIILLAGIFIFSGIFNIISNAMGKGCLTIKEYMEKHHMNYNSISEQKKARKMMNKDLHICAYNIVTELSLANKRQDIVSMEIQGWLNVGTVIIIMIILQLFRRKQRIITNHCDIEDVSSSDYTIAVQNIPQGLEVNYKTEIAKVFKDAGYNIVKVTPCFRFDHQLELEKKKMEVIKEKKAALNYYNKNGSYKEGDDIMEINKRIKEIEDQLEQLEEKFWNCGVEVSEDFCGVAFVSFNTEQEKEDILEKYKLRKRDIYRIHMNEHSHLKLENSLVYNDNILIIEQAPDPTDVIWENHSFTYKDRLKRKFVSNIISIILLLLGACCIYLLTALQIKEKNLAAKEANNPHRKGPPIMVKIIAILISVAIFIINFFLQITFIKLANYEKHLTRTHYNVSFAQKLSLAQFSNTALMTFLISFFIVKNYYGSGGLIYNQFFVFIMNMVVPNLMGLLNPGFYIKNFLRTRERKKDDKSLLTQAEAQKLFENPPYDISKAYADLLKTIFFTCFYAAIIPIGVFLSLIALAILYWVHKLNILKRANIPYNQGYELSLEMTEYLEFSIIIFSIGNFILEYAIVADISYSSIIAFVLAITNAVLPMEKFNKKIFPIEEAHMNEENFVEAEEYRFNTDYDRENPTTKERAVELITKKFEGK